ncbi:hypothetical protein BH10ACT1_BH10ACT1_10540 [soil metagenome]
MASAAAGCSGSSDGQQASTSGTVATTTTVAPTTATTVPPTTTTALEPVGAATPADATAALYAAFQAGDRAAAAKVAGQPAIDAIFAAVPGPYEPYRGCDTGEFGTSGCLYRDRSTNHTIQFDLEKVGDAWVVQTAFYSAD